MNSGLLRLREAIGRKQSAVAVRVGLPFGRGWLHDLSRLRLLLEGRVPIPCVAHPLCSWPDGSVRWAQVEFRASLQPHETAEIVADWSASAAEATPVRSRLSVGEGPAGMTIETGPAQLVVLRSGPVLGGLKLWGRGASSADDAVGVVLEGEVVGFEDGPECDLAVAHQTPLGAGLVRTSGGARVASKEWLRLEAAAAGAQATTLLWASGGDWESAVRLRFRLAMRPESVAVVLARGQGAEETRRAHRYHCLGVPQWRIEALPEGVLFRGGSGEHLEPGTSLAGVLEADDGLVAAVLVGALDGMAPVAIAGGGEELEMLFASSGEAAYQVLEWRIAGQVPLPSERALIAEPPAGAEAVIAACAPEWLEAAEALPGFSARARAYYPYFWEAITGPTASDAGLSESEADRAALAAAAAWLLCGVPEENAAIRRRASEAARQALQRQDDGGLPILPEAVALAARVWRDPVCEECASRASGLARKLAEGPPEFAELEAAADAALGLSVLTLWDGNENWAASARALAATVNPLRQPDGSWFSSLKEGPRQGSAGRLSRGGRAQAKWLAALGRLCASDQQEMLEILDEGLGFMLYGCRDAETGLFRAGTVVEADAWGATGPPDLATSGWMAEALAWALAASRRAGAQPACALQEAAVATLLALHRRAGGQGGAAGALRLLSALAEAGISGPEIVGRLLRVVPVLDPFPTGPEGQGELPLLVAAAGKTSLAVRLEVGADEESTADSQTLQAGPLPQVAALRCAGAPGGEVVARAYIGAGASPVISLKVGRLAGDIVGCLEQERRGRLFAALTKMDLPVASVIPEAPPEWLGRCDALFVDCAALVGSLWAESAAEHLRHGGVVCLLGLPGKEALEALFGDGVAVGARATRLSQMLMPGHPIFSEPTPLLRLPPLRQQGGKVMRLAGNWRVLAADEEGDPSIAEREDPGYLLLVAPQVIVSEGRAQAATEEVALLGNIVEHVLAKAGW